MAGASSIDILEAAYDVDQPNERWLKGLVRASHAALDAGLGVVVFEYDASVPERMRIPAIDGTAIPPIVDAKTILSGIEAAGGGRYVRGTFRTLQCETSSHTPDFAGSPADAMFASMGFGDMIGINGFDPGGLGVWLGIVMKSKTTLTPAQRRRYSRLSRHLAASHRLRRKLAGAAKGTARAPWNADAILSPRGRLEHAASEEARAESARSRLHDAAVALDRARGRLRRVDPDAALGDWTALVDARWTLVDKFDRDGKHYVLARRNETAVVGLDMLTPRERSVAAYAALGHSNKLIAYDLGIAHSTVRVLLARATAKLGVRSRAELVARVRALTDPPPSGG